MKKLTVLLLALSLSIGMTRSAHAQASAVSSAASSPQAAQAASFWGLIAKIPACLKACKAKFCASCCGQMFDSMLMPITFLTGGCVRCCPIKPSDQDLNKPGAEGACAAVTLDTLDAKNRLEAVRCLASVDCNYWPEAEKGLIGFLRADKNECVRLYAAMALAEGCCCTKNTIEALTLTVSGSTKDGNPAEDSPRVKAIALQALNNCLARYQDPVPSRPPEAPAPPEAPSPEGIPSPPPAGGSAPGELTPAPTGPMASYPYTYTTHKPKALDPVMIDAMRVADVANQNPPATSTMVRTGERDLFNILKTAVKPAPVKSQVQTAKATASTSLKPPAPATALASAKPASSPEPKNADSKTKNRFLRNINRIAFTNQSTQ